MANQPDTATSSRQRFLEAADKVYLQHGYSKSTIRLISTEAGTSLAQLNRHWKSKQALFKEVLSRHFNPIHQEQHKAFDQIEKEGLEHDIRAVLTGFLSPAMLTAHTDRTSHLIYCKALLDPAEEATEIVNTLIRQVYPRVVDLLRNALPNLTDEDFFFALGTVMGAYVYSQTRGQQIAARVGIEFDSIHWQDAGARLANLLCTGLQNPGEFK